MPALKRPMPCVVCGAPMRVSGTAGRRRCSRACVLRSVGLPADWTRPADQDDDGWREACLHVQTKGILDRVTEARR